ncbi:MAG: DUF3450 family protein [Proteobacteria bacterium]|nr:DUF3450 family protein [Pseudomonadota bacterium]
MNCSLHSILGRVAGLGVLAALALPGSAAAEDAAAFASQLADLRADVAALNEAIEAEKEGQRGRLRSLDAQKAELEAQIRREELRIRQLRSAVAEREALLADDVEGADTLVPVVLETLAGLRASVKSGLPFRVTERLDALAELERKTQDGTLRPQRAAARTWQFIEDELRLTRETSLDRQVIQLEGEDHLVEIARVGMIALYFRTDAGRVGRAIDGAEGWTFEPITDAATEARVLDVFDALTKQIRSGWFELPMEAM